MTADDTTQLDDTPFPDLPVAASQPDRMETVARLAALTPRGAAEARVLELASASGQNLIPLAERYPGATFVGIDASPRRVAMARRAAADVGLSNIEFRREDFRSPGPDLGSFDYIIAHNLYSWVEADVRDAILTICRDHLAPAGVAYVSYKTYPGWHVHDLLRDMMLYDARGGATRPSKRRWRRLLGFLGATLTGDRPYDELMRVELQALAQVGDTYLRHEHLRPVSYPVYYRQFVAHAASRALKPLGDCVLGVRQHDYLGGAIEARLAELTSDPIELEQYRDIVRNRGQRQTLLCHQAAAIDPFARPQRLRGLYVEAPLKSESETVDLRSSQPERFTSEGGLRITTGVPLAKAALVQLGAAWPRSLRFETLIAAAVAAWQAANDQADVPPAEIARLEENLWQCCAGGVITPGSGPDSFTVEISALPVASPWARWQAEHGQLVTNRKHQPQRMEYLERQVLQLCDGRHDQTAIVEGLMTLVSQGQMAIRGADGQVENEERTRSALTSILANLLTQLCAQRGIDRLKLVPAWAVTSPLRAPRR